VTVDDDQLVHAVDRLVDQVGHWPPARWSRPSSVAGQTRADVIHALAQRLADLEATASGRAPRPVPRLDNDLALPDQIRVMVLDLLRAEAGPVLLAEALDAVTQARGRI
jgi:hypothetical protein